MREIRDVRRRGPRPFVVPRRPRRRDRARSSIRPASRPPTSTPPTAAGCDIAWTLDTHSHADYVSGSPELAARTGATFLAPAASRLEHAASRRSPTATRSSSPTRCRCEAIATPGHTPDHLAYLLVERRPAGRVVHRRFADGRHRRAHRPARPRAAPSRSPASMFRSLRDGSTSLPDDLAVYPTHGAGSFCSAPGGAERTTTIGRERATNPLFAIADEDAFVERLLAGFGSFPTYFARLPELNRRGPRRYGALPRLDRARRSTTSSATSPTARVVVDVRPVAAFAAGHIPGSLSIDAAAGVRQLARLARRPRPAARVRPRRRPGPRRARPPMPRRRLRAPRRRARRRHRRLDAQPDARSRTIALVEPGRDASARSSTSARPTSTPPATSPARATSSSAPSPTADLPDGPVTVMCGHGERAMTGASILTARGHARRRGARRRSRQLGRRDRPAARRPADEHADHRRARSGSGCARTSPSSRCSSASTRSSAG